MEGREPVITAEDSEPLQEPLVAPVLTSRFDDLLHSTLARFLVVGGISYLVNQVLLFSLYEGGFRSMTGANAPFDTGLLAASALALEASILVRFTLNDQWTFHDCHSKPYWRRLTESNLELFGRSRHLLVRRELAYAAAGHQLPDCQLDRYRLWAGVELDVGPPRRLAAGSRRSN